MSLLLFFAAILPLLLLLALMTVFRLSAGKAALIDLLFTAVLAVLVFKGGSSLLLWECVKGAWDALPIVLIILTAVLLYQVGKEADAFSSLRIGLERLLPNELLLVLALGWCFPSFLQGISGFGVPVAVAAPLLIGIGVKPVYAVMLALLGQSWGNTFGTLAAAWDALVAASGAAGASQAALWASFFLFLWDIAIGVVSAFFYGRGRAVRKSLPALIVISFLQGGGELLLSQVNTTLCNFVPAALSLIAVIALGRLPLYRERWAIEDSPMMERKGISEEGKAALTIMDALLPYILLTALTLLVLALKPLSAFLSKVSFGPAVPETRTGLGVVNAGYERYSAFKPFTHASFMLLLSSLAGWAYYSIKGIKLSAKTLIKGTLKLSMPSAVAVVLLMMMSKVMCGSGMTQVLSEGIASALGRFYTVLVPFIGLLGTFSTGSNLSSNILFGSFQGTTAGLLGLNVPAVLGAQTAGGAIGSMVSPGKILLGTSTAGLSGKEGMILSRLLRIALPAVLLIGLLLLIVA